jgi:UDP-sugar transporter A1/2/3
MYSAASAVLLNELLKGAISLSIAFRNAVKAAPSSGREYSRLETADEHDRRRVSVDGSAVDAERLQAGGRKLLQEVFRWAPSLPLLPFASS